MHLPVLQSLPGVDVVAVAGRDGARARDVAGQHGIARAVTDLDALLDSDLDAVTFALPPLANEAAVRAAIARGLPVLCEKPLAASSPAADEIARAATGVVTGVDFLMSELNSFRALKDLIDDGRLGDVSTVTVAWLADSWAHRSGQWSWKTDQAAGGGVMALLGSHLLHLVEWLLGPVVAVTATSSTAATQRLTPAGAVPAADTVAFSTVHANGAVVTATVTNAAPGLSEHRWHVVGNRASASVVNAGRDWMSGFTTQLRTRDGAEQLASEPQDGVDGRVPPFARLADRFVSAIRDEGPVSPDFAAGARVQLLMAEIDRAAAERSWVAVP